MSFTTLHSTGFMIAALLCSILLSSCDSKMMDKMDESKLRPEAVTRSFGEALFSGASIDELSPYISSEFKQNMLSYGSPKQYARVMLDLALDSDVEISTHILQQKVMSPSSHDTLKEVSIVIAIKGERQGQSRNAIKVAKLRQEKERWRVHAVEHPSFDLQRRFGIATHH